MIDEAGGCSAPVVSTTVGAQFVIATHSSFLMGYAQAVIYELTESGVVRSNLDDLPAVVLWHRYLRDPEHYYARLSQRH